MVSGLPEPVHQHLQGLITDQVRVLWEHGSLLVTASRELDLRLRLVAGINIQGLAMGGGGGYVGKQCFFDDGEEYDPQKSDGGGSGHFATMNIQNLAAIDKKLVVKKGAGGRSITLEIDYDSLPNQLK